MDVRSSGEKKKAMNPLQRHASSVHYVPASVLLSTQWFIDAVTLIWVSPINHCSSSTAEQQLQLKQGYQSLESS